MSLRNLKRILVTGGAGFMGSAFIRYLLQKVDSIEKIVNFDLLTYAGNLQNVASVEKDPRYLFSRGDINYAALIEELIRVHRIDTIVHFAAESHVDRSIDHPHLFYRTNVEGTISLLEVVRRFPNIHFHHISTDEVYGSAVEGEFSEQSPYRPNSPYAASKAAGDHFVRAYVKTYGINATISHSSNNYGPYQHPEKFIPRMIYGCMKKEPLPIYGQGINVRDWIYVEDHAEAVWNILQKGKIGQTYNIGSKCEKKNIDLLKELIAHFSEIKKEKAENYLKLITFVQDRPGHDLRYALCTNKISRELEWTPRHDFDQGIHKTILWYLTNSS